MKILFIAPRFHTNQKDMVKKLVNEGHSVFFFVIGVGNSETHEVLKPEIIPISNLTNFILYFFKNIDFPKYATIAIPKSLKYFSMLKNKNPDAIILRNGSIPIYSWIPLLFAVIYNKKIIFYTQGPIYVEKISTIRKIHDWFFIKILKIKWFSPVLYINDIKNKTKLNYISFIPFFNFVNFRKNGYEHTSKVRFISVSKFTPRKNIKLLVEVFKSIIDEFKNVELTIVGSDDTINSKEYLEEIKSLIFKNGLENNIKIKVNIKINEVYELYKMNDVFILLSEKESATISQMEAMSFGLAVICSRDNGTAHYIENGVNGYLINPKFEEIKSAVLSYLKYPSLKYLHGCESIKKLNEDLSIENSYNKLVKLING